VNCVVYVPLASEGTECWRAVHADRVDGDTYEITVDKEPDGERWTFPPRSRVRCCEQIFSDGKVGLVAVGIA
jgi:hypothetical protein